MHLTKNFSQKLTLLPATVVIVLHLYLSNNSLASPATPPSHSDQPFSESTHSNRIDTETLIHSAHLKKNGQSVINYSPTADTAQNPSLLMNKIGQRPAHKNRHADLWQRMRQGFQLDGYARHKRVQNQIKWYQRHPYYLNQIIHRTSLYLYHVIEQIEQQGLPLELALLPIVESNYNPFALSKDQAAGLWQFMPKTAHQFNLGADGWHDPKRDVQQSTKAALDYLLQLYQRFDDDWLLAIAAYNAGRGTVGNARYRNLKKDRPMEFFSLQLPGETRIYVARLLALAHLINTPDAYNVKLHPLPNQPYYQTVQLPQQIDLPLAAMLIGLPTNELYHINPGMITWVTPPEGPHRINIPTSHIHQFNSALSQLGAHQWVRWLPYVIQPGQTLLSIANEFDTTPRTLRLINRIRGSQLYPGQHLLVPTAPSLPH